MKKELTPSVPAVFAAPLPRYAVSPRVAVSCVALFVLTFVLVHLLRTDLDPTWHPISLYALGAHGWLMTLCFVAWGAGPIALAAAVRTQAPTRTAKVALVVLVLGAVGPLLAGLFPMDPLGTKPDQMSTAGRVHVTGAVLGDLLPLAALALSVSFTRPGRLWAGAKLQVRSAGVLAFALWTISSVAMGMMMPASGELGPEVTVGWLMRAFIVATNAWVAVAAWATLLVQSRRAHPSEEA